MPPPASNSSTATHIRAIRWLRRGPGHPRDLPRGGSLRARRFLAGYWEDAVHSLRDCKNVVDVRNLGLIGAIELEAIPGEATRRGFSAFLAAFEKGLLIRTTGDVIALSPPLIISRAEIDQIVEILSGVLKRLQ